MPSNARDLMMIAGAFLMELRATRGQDFPTSMGGRLMVQILSDKRFQAFLEIEHGVRKPARNSRHPIIYGKHRKS